MSHVAATWSVSVELGEPSVWSLCPASVSWQRLLVGNPAVTGFLAAVPGRTATMPVTSLLPVLLVTDKLCLSPGEFSFGFEPARPTV